MSGRPGGAAGEKKPAAADQGADAMVEQAMKDSPYVQADTVEEYKQQAYGTEGHQQVKQGRGAGSTEGPTVSGAHLTTKEDISATETINQRGVN